MSNVQAKTRRSLPDEVLDLIPPATAPVPFALNAGDQIVAIGDSITQSGGYLRMLDAVFARQYGDLRLPKIINVGISGQKAEELAARFDRDVIAAGPDVVTISVGINDVWHRLGAPHDPQVLEMYGRNLERMVNSAQDAGAKVFLLAPTAIEEDRGSEGNRRLALYVQAGKEVARRGAAGYVDLHTLFLEAFDRLAERRSAFSFGRFTSDGVHMEPAGDVLMAIGIARAFGVSDEKLRATDPGDVL